VDHTSRHRIELLDVDRGLDVLVDVLRALRAACRAAARGSFPARMTERVPAVAGGVRGVRQHVAVSRMADRLAPANDVEAGDEFGVQIRPHRGLLDMLEEL